MLEHNVHLLGKPLFITIRVVGCERVPCIHHFTTQITGIASVGGEMFTLQMVLGPVFIAQSLVTQRTRVAAAVISFEINLRQFVQRPATCTTSHVSYQSIVQAPL